VRRLPLSAEEETVDLLTTLSTYLPYTLAEHIRRGPARPLFNRGKRLEAVALFADMAGFTPLAEALGARGSVGTEELTRILNGRFTPLIEEIENWGGVVGKFAGDAMTVLFHGAEMERRALACAAALRAVMLRLVEAETPAGRFTIQMKLGLAAGTVLQMVAGSAARAEFVFAGRPLDDAAQAEHRARPGEIVLHPSLRERLPADELAGEALAAGYLRFDALRTAAAPAPHPPLPPPTDEARAVAALRAFLPAEIHARLAAGQAAFVNEHRRVTILFLSFAGIDYAAAGAIAALGRYVEQLFQVVGRFGGHVRQVQMGDKGSLVLVLFGAPVAHENDEERALLCALALQELAGQMGEITAQRIGVNSGLVFAGNVGSARRQEYTVIGDAVNLAARLMQAAAPGQVLVGESSQEAAAERFTWRALPPLVVKGKAEPVAVHELAGRRADRPLRLQEPRYALPMVGRRADLELLEGLLARVRASGRGHVAGLSAEAGMGKSRLTAEVIGRALALGFAGYGGYAVSHGTQTPYMAWRPLLRGLLEMEEGRPLDEQLPAATRVLAAVRPDLPPRLPLLGDALGLPIADNELTAAFDAGLRRESLQALVVDLVRQRAAETPLLLVLEDAHWLDDLSRELARALAAAIADRPVFFLTVYRPAEVAAGTALWARPPAAFTELELAPFAPAETADLIRLKLAGRALPPHMVEQIEARSQGNPFFVDEFVTMLLERGIDLDDPAALADVEVPLSLQTLVISRLDELSESEKTTIRVASVIGRLFRARWLLAIYPGEIRAELLNRDLDRLSALGLAPLDKPAPELEYLFKHAITQEVAYESLSFATRRMLHERMAAYIEETYAGKLEEWYGILAYHFGRAERPAQEFTYTRQAGEQAARQSAHRQAVEFYGRALALRAQHGLGTAAEEADLRMARLKQNDILGLLECLDEDAQALAAIAGALDPARLVQSWILRGIAAWKTDRLAEAAACYKTAEELARQHGDHLGLLDALRFQGDIHFSRGNYGPGKDLLQQVIAEAGEPGWLQEAHACRTMGWIVYDEGNLEECERYWLRALDLSRAHGSKPGEASTVIELGVLYATLLYVDKGIAYLERGRDWSAQLGYRLGELQSCRMIAETWRSVGQYERSWDALQRGLALAGHLRGEVFESALIRSNLAEVLLETGGDLDQAERWNWEALEASREVIGKEGISWHWHTRGRVLLRRGALEEARQALEEAVQLRRDVGTPLPGCAALADLGRLHLRRGDLEAARACVDEILTWIHPAGGRDLEGPEAVPALFTCFLVFREAGEEGRAAEMLHRAQETLQRYAGRIGDEEIRRSFLQRVSYHREVVEAASGRP